MPIGLQRRLIATGDRVNKSFTRDSSRPLSLKRRLRSRQNVKSPNTRAYTRVLVPKL